MRSHLCAFSFTPGTSDLNACSLLGCLVLRLSMMDACLPACMPVSETSLISRCVQRTIAHRLHVQFQSLLTLLFLFPVVFGISWHL